VLSGDTGTDANEQLPLQRSRHAGLAQNVIHHVWLAAKQNNLSLLHSGEVIVLYHLDYG
jgi:hypothetical protein